MKLALASRTLIFDDGSELGDYHRQECCEEVYADFENMMAMVDGKENYVDAKDLDFFDDILKSIVPIEGLGFYIVTKQGVCLLVSCYNVQNGYYSDELSLCFERNGEKEYMDITPCTGGWGEL